MEKEAPRSLWKKMMGGLSMPPPIFGGVPLPPNASTYSSTAQAQANMGIAGNGIQYPYQYPGSLTSASAANPFVMPKSILSNDGDYYACVKEISNGYLIHVVTKDGKEIQRIAENYEDLANNIQAALVAVKMKG